MRLSITCRIASKVTSAHVCQSICRCLSPSVRPSVCLFARLIANTRTNKVSSQILEFLTIIHRCLGTLAKIFYSCWACHSCLTSLITLTRLNTHNEKWKGLSLLSFSPLHKITVISESFLTLKHLPTFIFNLAFSWLSNINCFGYVKVKIKHQSTSTMYASAGDSEAASEEGGRVDEEKTISSTTSSSLNVHRPWLST